MIKSNLAFVTIGFILIQLSCFAQNEIKTYNDSLGFYSFTYPENFEIKKMGPAAVQIISALSSTDDKFQETLTIQVSMAPENIAIDSLSSLLTRNMQMSYFVCKDFRHEKVVIAGYEGRKLSMTVMDKDLISISESFALIKGLILRISYRNEFQTNSSEIVSFPSIINSLKTNW
jgi:hypothetical protein